VISRHIDHWLERLKWPIGFLATAWLPFILWACWKLAVRVLEAPRNTIAFLVGIAVFVVGWRLVLRFQSLGIWLMKAEHEATHLLFAVLTAHPILGLGRDAKQGTHVRFLGRGNWLIQIAPYFFPTAAIFCWLLAAFVPLGSLFGLASLALGIATAFHVISTLREVRRDADELKTLSWQFCWLFLPAANLWMLGATLAFAQNGLSRLLAFVGDSLLPLTWLWSVIWNLLAGS
jgi:hypothetical protein